MTLRWQIVLSVGFLPILGCGFDCAGVQPAPVCDENCQFCQQKALLQYIWPLNGPNWERSEGWPVSGTLAGFVAQAHCRWYGVLCCGADHTILDNPSSSHLDGIMTNLTKCEVPLGVAVLILGSNGLSGPLDSQILASSALRLSLEVIRAESKLLLLLPSVHSSLLLSMLTP